MIPVAVILTAILFSAYFSGMEIAFVSANQLKIELDRKHGIFSARIVKVFQKNPGHFIVTLLVGNNIALVIYGILVARILEPLLIYNLNLQNELAILLIQTLAGTLVIIFAGEFIPKALFRSRPNMALNIFSIPTLIISIILLPISLFVVGISNFILRLFFGIRQRESKKIQSRVFGKLDLDHLLSDSQSGHKPLLNDRQDKKIFRNALDFSNRKVRDCMIPRTEVEAIEVNSSLDDLKSRFIETGYSKLLVFDDNIDNIIGYVSSKALFRKAGSIKSELIKLFFIPESMPVNKLFRKLIRERKSIALVVDEFGGTSGIVTLEDIIEEIFGEIEDEHDTIDFVERQINEDEYIFSGRLEIDYLKEKYQFRFEESEEYDTLAGLIIHHYESIPRLNTRVIIPPYEFRILKVGQTRIELVKIKAAH
jgi:CBS domain containing-hemolysin-like protein